MEVLVRKAWPAVCASAKDARVFLQNNAHFFRMMSKRQGVCPNAWLFGALVGAVLALLSLPAFRGAGVDLSYDFAALLIALNWLFLFIYGACFGVAGKLMGGQRVLVAVNAFFYVAMCLIVVKVIEMPALEVRMDAMVGSCSLGTYEEAVTRAIMRGEVSARANGYVLLGYLFFFALVVRMQKQLYGFGWLKGVVSALLGMAFLSGAVIIVQQPAISSLACGYVH